MGSSRFWLKVADEESKSFPHEFPRSHWLKATGQCVMERYLSATMLHPFFATTCFLTESINNIDFYALEIFCRVLNFSTIKLEFAKLLARSIYLLKT